VHYLITIGNLTPVPWESCRVIKKHGSSLCTGLGTNRPAIPNGAISIDKLRPVKLVFAVMLVSRLDTN
jgi:hypothetical protein